MANKPQTKPAHGESAMAKAPALIRMIRDGKTADVHPQEVDNFAAGGWVKE